MTGQRRSLEAARANARNEACEACGKAISDSEFVICLDGITNKTVTFHKGCDPNDASLQRHHGVILKPAVFGLKVNEMPFGNAPLIGSLSTRFKL